MPNKLNLFPTRVPIGRATDAAGRSFDVLMTREFANALADLMARVGGTNNFSTDELVALLSTDPTDTAALATLQRTVIEQAHQLAAAGSLAARVASLERQLSDLAVLASGAAPAPVDWEHPGKIGAATANSGKFKALEATGAVKLSPAGQPVDVKPTGAAVVTIQPEQPGQIDNMELGKTTPRAARVITVNKVTITAPAAAATLTLADGATLIVPAPGGTLGSGAYANAGAFAARTNTALAAVATDPASTQALANSLRAVLLSVGIGS